VTTCSSPVNMLIMQRSRRLAVQVLTDLAPHVADAIVYDRDDFMTKSLLNICTDKVLPPGNRVVVAVVGLAHLDGIERRFSEVVPQDGMK
jgi:pheromone shutdown protein TraB